MLLFQALELSAGNKLYSTYSVRELCFIKAVLTVNKITVFSVSEESELETFGSNYYCWEAESSICSGCVKCIFLNLL